MLGVVFDRLGLENLRRHDANCELFEDRNSKSEFCGGKMGRELGPCLDSTMAMASWQRV